MHVEKTRHLLYNMRKKTCLYTFLQFREVFITLLCSTSILREGKVPLVLADI